MVTMHDSVVKTKYYMRESVPTNAPFLTPKAVLTSAEAFANASKAVSSGSPLQKGRVNIAKISLSWCGGTRCSCLPRRSVSLGHWRQRRRKRGQSLRLCGKLWASSPSGRAAAIMTAFASRCLRSTHHRVASRTEARHLLASWSD